jgi:hypothetical protein
LNDISIYLIAESQLFMASRFIFGCCNDRSTVTDAEGQFGGLLHPLPARPKKMGYLLSPKASLKSLANLRGNKHLETAIVASQINLASTRDIASEVPVPGAVEASPAHMEVSGSLSCGKTHPTRM